MPRARAYAGRMYEYDYVRQRAGELQREAAAERLAREALAGRSTPQRERWLPLELTAAIVVVGMGVSLRLFGLALN